MDSGYLGAIILSACFLLFAAGYWLLRANSSNRLLTSEGLAIVFALIITALFALGIAVFAGNAYLTDTDSTIISALMVLGSASVAAVTLWRSKSAADNGISSSAKNVDLQIPNGRTDQPSKPISSKKRPRKLAA